MNLSLEKAVVARGAVIALVAGVLIFVTYCTVGFSGLHYSSQLTLYPPAIGI